MDPNEAYRQEPDNRPEGQDGTTQEQDAAQEDRTADSAAPDALQDNRAQDSAAPDALQDNRMKDSAAPDGIQPERADGPGYGFPQGSWPGGPLSAGPRTGWQPPSPKERAAAGMAAAALILGVLSILCSCTVYGSLLAGGLAVILALLSKGKKNKMTGMAKAGAVTGCAGLVMAVCLLISSFHMVLTDPDANRMFNEMFEQYYGESLDDAIQNTFGGQLPE